LHEPLLHLQPPGISPPPGPYTHVVGTQRAALYFVSGQVGAGEDGNLLDGIEAQTHQAFRNLELAVASCGVGMENVVKLTSYVAGVDNLDAFRSARFGILQRHYPLGTFPAHTLLAVAALALPEILVEVEAVVAVPDSTGA